MNIRRLLFCSVCTVGLLCGFQVAIGCLQGPLHRCNQASDCSKEYTCVEQWCVPSEFSKKTLQGKDGSSTLEKDMTEREGTDVTPSDT